MIGWLNYDDVRVRTAALEQLTEGFESSAEMLQAIFAAWDRFGVNEAYPEFPLVMHLPTPESMIDEAISRAASMALGRKLIEPGCRCAGKLMEAYSIASTASYRERMEAIISLKQVSKIFFRVDIDGMYQRLELSKKTSDELREHFSAKSKPNSEMTYDLSFALHELHYRNEADDLLRLGLDAATAADVTCSAFTQACLQVASRNTTHGHEIALLELLDHSNSGISDLATIALSRCQSGKTLDAISSRFVSLMPQGQIRATEVLKRLRVPGAASRIRFLREESKNPDANEALFAAEILQFDMTELEDWLEAFLVISDRAIERLESRLWLMKPLATGLPADDQHRVITLMRQRLQ